jgi:rhodanese-related sulfurtransferase
MFIACDEAKRLIAQAQAQLVDVRTPEEVSMSGVPGALNIPLHEIEQLAAQKLDKTKPVIVFCRSGQRSHMAQHILMSQGFNEVHNLGSFMAWFQCPDR